MNICPELLVISAYLRTIYPTDGAVGLLMDLAYSHRGRQHISFNCSWHVKLSEIAHELLHQTLGHCW